MSTAEMVKVEVEAESCCACGGTGGDLFTPEEYDAAATYLTTPLRLMLLKLNQNKVIPDGRFCNDCARRAVDAYEFSCTLSSNAAPPLSDKIRELRKKLLNLTKIIDVFIVVGGPGPNSGGTYNKDDIIMVDKDALAVATTADEEEMDRARNACGEPVYQCTVCPESFQRASELVAHSGVHGAGAAHACWTCGARLPSRQAARAHARHHAARADHTRCQLCQTTFQSVSALRAHEAICEPRCPVPECGLRCDSRWSLSEHVSRRHELVCAACFARLPSAEAAALHALCHRAGRQFVCGHAGCVLRFAARHHLLAHIADKHTDRTAPPPDQSGDRTSAPADVVPCDFCTRTFGSAAAMKRHRRVHRPRQPDTQEWSGVESEGSDVEYLQLETLDDARD